MLVTVRNYKYFLSKGMGHWEEAEGQGAGSRGERDNFLFSPLQEQPPALLPLPQSPLQFKTLEKITAGS